MRKLAVVVVSLTLAFATGCATKGHVKSQVDPLSERIGGIEARLDAIDTKLAEMSREAELAKGDRAAIAEARSLAQEAKAEAMRAGENSAQALAAAERAEQAAKAAQNAAARTERMFQLQQKK